jgi:hypothetical protein
MNVAFPRVQWAVYEHCILPTNLPVRPPAFDNVFMAPDATEVALEIADPADEVTRVRPSEALSMRHCGFPRGGRRRSSAAARRVMQRETWRRAETTERRDGSRWGRRLRLRGWSSGKRISGLATWSVPSSAKVGWMDNTSLYDHHHHHLASHLFVAVASTAFVQFRCPKSQLLASLWKSRGFCYEAQRAHPRGYSMVYLDMARA